MKYAPTALRNGRHVKVIADNNTVISGYLWRGAPNRVLEAAKQGQLSLFTSDALLAELSGVLQRAKFASAFERNNTTAAAVLAEYATLARIVVATPLPAPVCDDPDDDAVIACAIAAGADVIVSGDDDLLRLGRYGITQILTAAELLQHLASSQP